MRDRLPFAGTSWTNEEDRSKMWLAGEAEAGNAGEQPAEE